jgi:hypothetical protein
MKRRSTLALFVLGIRDLLIVAMPRVAVKLANRDQGRAQTMAKALAKVGRDRACTSGILRNRADEARVNAPQRIIAVAPLGC